MIENKRKENSNIEVKEIIDFAVFLIKGLAILISALIVNVITRFPLFENFGLNRIAHYKYRNIRKLSNYIEKHCKSVQVKEVSLDGNFCTLNLYFKKSRLNKKMIANKLNSSVRKYLKNNIDNIYFRPDKNKGKLLIPLEYLIMS